MISLYQQHCERWKNGCGSDQCDRANNVVLAKGSIPCDVLLVGEAPGISENQLGYPFAGPAGKLLGEIVKNTLKSPPHRILTSEECAKTHDPDRLCDICDGGLGYCTVCHGGEVELVNTTCTPLEVAYTNLVGCMPRDGEGRKAGEPSPDQVRSCEKRLTELIRIAEPKAIVMVGDLAKKHVPQIEFGEAKLVHIVHPAFILRTVPVQRSMLIRRCELILSQLAKELRDA